jgi:hypothetical protein
VLDLELLAERLAEEIRVGAALRVGVVGVAFFLLTDHFLEGEASLHSRVQLSLQDLDSLLFASLVKLELSDFRFFL